MHKSLDYMINQLINIARNIHVMLASFAETDQYLGSSCACQNLTLPLRLRSHQALRLFHTEWRLPCVITACYRSLQCIICMFDCITSFPEALGIYGTWAY